MIFLSLAILMVLGGLLIVVTVIQTCYLESLRLRPRDYPTLGYFDEQIAPALGVKTDLGALAFSLWKHSLLAVLAVPLMGIAERWWEIAALALLSMLNFGYALPQWIYRRGGGHWMGVALPVFRLMLFLARPWISLLNLGKALAEFGDEEKPAEDTTNEDIQALIEAGEEEGIIEEGDKQLIRTVIEFGDKTVREVMTPRPNVVAISDEATLEELRQLVINEKYSRIPVFRGALDNMVGFVHVRDMFEVDNAQRNRRRVRDIMRDLDAVPETKPAGLLLREMQRDGKHMVAVVDEYGGIAGIVTMEDLLEEVFGEIRDEHEPTADVIKEADGSFIVAGTFDLDHLSDLLMFTPGDSTEATTIGGLVTEWTGHVPQAGEFVERDGLRIEVLAASDLHVDRVRLSRAEADLEEERGLAS
jgi:putative hemolysin